MKIGRKFPPVKPAHWRLKKARAVYINRRDFNIEYLPKYTTDIEIVTGEGYGIRLESTEVNTPTLIIRET